MIEWKKKHSYLSHYFLKWISKALFIRTKVGPGHPSPQANFTSCLHGKTWARLWWAAPLKGLKYQLAQLGLARRLDSLETVYTRKSWLTPQGHPVLPTEWPYPPSRFAVSHVNSRRWFLSNCRKTWLAPVGSGWGCLGSLGQLFSV